MLLSVFLSCGGKSSDPQAKQSRDSSSVRETVSSDTTTIVSKIKEDTVDGPNKEEFEFPQDTISSIELMEQLADVTNTEGEISLGNFEPPIEYHVVVGSDERYFISTIIHYNPEFHSSETSESLYSFWVEPESGAVEYMIYNHSKKWRLALRPGENAAEVIITAILEQ